MWYIHFRDKLAKSSNIESWSKWYDSSYGPYPIKERAATFCLEKNKLTEETGRQYAYSASPANAGKSPAGGIPGSKFEPDAKGVGKTQVESKGMPKATTTWTPDRGPQMADANSVGDPKGVTIYKYQLPILEQFEIQLPESTNILRVDDMDGKFWMWVLHDLRKPMKTYKFHMFKTGAHIPDDIASKLMGYAGFCKLHIQQELCLYVFMEG